MPARILTLTPAHPPPSLPPLQVHSHFSLHCGASPVTALVQAAVDARCPALALTDRNAMYGVVPFLAACREADLPAILGVTLDDPVDAARRAALWARNREGYAVLADLTTRRCVDPESFDLVAELARLDPALIWAGTAHLTLLVQVARRRSPQGWVALLMPDDRPVHAPPDQLLGWARRLKLLTALTSDVLMARPSDLKAQEIQRRIATRYHGRWTPGEEALTATPDTVIWDVEAQRRWAGRYPEAAWGALEVADHCAGQVDLKRQAWVMPPCNLPTGVSPEEALRERAEGGCRRRFGHWPPPAVSRRLRYELQIICDLGYAAYFMVGVSLVDQAHAWGAVTLGRGSVADSLVAYCIGLTEVDPIAHDLYFERFLNPAREDPPDIDLDFSWKVRDRMLQFLFDSQPPGHVAMVGCHHKLHARGAFREAALALGLRADQVALSKRLPYTHALHLGDIQEHYPEVADLPLDDPEVVEALRIGQALAGTPIATGMHPCGIVLAPRPLTWWTPLERCNKGYLSTHFEMNAVESVGLIKIDVLATRGLGTVDTVRATLRERGAPDPLTADFDTYAGHPSARRLLREGRSIGCFYTESPVMLQLNKRTRCSTYEVLVATSSVVRPGVAESGMMDLYIDRHRGWQPTVHLHPLMGELLKETHGVMIYQEDVLKVAHHLAGMSLAEADSLRRATSFKKRGPIPLSVVQERFLNGCRSKDIEPAIAEEIWRQIASFADFAFCKAHSAAYARLSMQTCRLKAEYPAEFMAAVLSNEGGYYGPLVYIEEARRWGLRISGPDVNGSQRDYWGYGVALRIGLMAIKGLTEESIALIVRTRSGVPYSDFPDFLYRTRTGAGGLDPTQVLLLIDAGACDGFGDTVADMSFMLLTHLERVKAQGDRGTLPLFPEAEAVMHLGGTGAGDRHKRYATWLDLYGYLPPCHPLTWLRPVLHWTEKGPPLIDVRDLPRYAGQQVRLMGLGVTRKITVTRKAGERMAFLSLDDETGTAEVTFFPRAYERVARGLHGWGPFVVTGLVEARRGVVSLNASAVERALVSPSVALPEQFSRTVIAPFNDNPNFAPLTPALAWLVAGDAPLPSEEREEVLASGAARVLGMVG